MAGSPAGCRSPSSIPPRCAPSRSTARAVFRSSSGVVALRDPADPAQTLVLASDGPHGMVRIFDLTSNGRLVPDRVPAVAIAGPLDADFADFHRSFPSTLVASADGRSVYVVNNVADTVVTIDVPTRALSGPPIPVGFFPLAAALAGRRLLVANEGLL